MGSREDEKDRRRAERLEAERRESSGDRRRLLVGYGVAAVLVVAIVAAIAVVVVSGGDGSDGDATAAKGGAQGETENVNTMYGVLPDGIAVDTRAGIAPPKLAEADLDAAARAAGCELELSLKDEGNTHLDPGSDDLPDYGTNPPTSGDHYPNPLADGVFLDTPSPGNYVHSLEHGRIEIEYHPDLAERSQLALKGVVEEDRAGMIMFPNDELDGEVAVAAWTRLMSCPRFRGAKTLDAVRDFRDSFRGRGPEAIPY